MGRLRKAFMAAMVLALPVAYAVSLTYVNGVYAKKAHGLERTTALYDIKKEHLYRQATSLETLYLDLAAQLEAEQEKAGLRRLQMSLNRQYDTPGPQEPTLDQTAVGQTPPVNQTAIQQANQRTSQALADRLSRLSELQRKSTTTSRKVTRAS